MIEFADIVNKAIHCPTEEDSIAYMKLLIDLSENIHWAQYNKTLSTNSLNRSYDEETCYRVDENKIMRFGQLEYYQNNGYEIIALKDIIETETETETEPILSKEERFKILSDLL